MTRYRVLPGTGDGPVLVDLTPTDDPADAYEPIAVTRLPDEPAVRPGNVVRTRLESTDGPTDVTEASVERRDRFRYADGVENLFDAARDLWRDTRLAGDAIGSRVTHSTDGAPNGALYVFSDAGPEDLFAAFRDGRRPIDPLVELVDDADDTSRDEATTLRTGGLTARLDRIDSPPAETDTPNADRDDERPRRAVYVLRPAGDPFVAVSVVFRRDGLLARTMNDTYF